MELADRLITKNKQNKADEKAPEEFYVRLDSQWLARQKSRFKEPTHMEIRFKQIKFGKEKKKKMKGSLFMWV